MVKKRILSVFGTRPEAIKMAPVINALKSDDRIHSGICVTGQHRQMLDQVLKLYKLIPEYDLDIMKQSQSLSDVSGNILLKMDKIFNDFCPDLVLVHGDTNTALTASMSAFYNKIKIGHVEAGLRTGDVHSPWPEEFNRRVVGIVADYHFCPTVSSRDNLLREGISVNKIYVTGNTVIDSLVYVKNLILSTNDLLNFYKSEFDSVLNGGKIILVTGHRRENFGAGFENICLALKLISEKYPNFQIVYPVHLNPNVQIPVKEILGGISNIHLIDPLDYMSFIFLMMNSYLILTDSGGVQEEAPSLGKPVLVMRNVTERPEAIVAGTVKLVGNDVLSIVSSVSELIDDSKCYEKMSLAINPYGDGLASQRILAAITSNFTT